MLNKSFTGEILKSPRPGGWTYVIWPNPPLFFKTRDLVKVVTGSLRTVSYTRREIVRLFAVSFYLGIWLAALTVSWRFAFDPHEPVPEVLTV
jgi:hypothetical protein